MPCFLINFDLFCSRSLTLCFLAARNRQTSWNQVSCSVQVSLSSQSWLWNHLTYMTISVRVHIRVSNDVCNRVKFFSPSNPSIYSATSYCVWDLLPLPKTWLSFSFWSDCGCWKHCLRWLRWVRNGVANVMVKMLVWGINHDYGQKLCEKWSYCNFIIRFWVEMFELFQIA